MTLNAEVFHKTTAEVNTQVASYFGIVDECIQAGDTNHNYRIDAQSSYAPGPPIQAGSYTTFIISPTCDNMCDLYNGFIRAQLKCKFTIDQALTSDEDNHMFYQRDGEEEEYHFNRMWFGFKDAMDAVEKYEIMSNGVTVYSQNFAPEESFITSCATNESVKRTDIFSKARHKDIWNQKFVGCGVGVQWGTDEGDDGETITREVTIPLKIDIRRFLPLSNIKYLPAFAGKLELRVLFGTSAMVYTPCGPHYDLQRDIPAMAALTFPAITREFVPIGDPCVCYTSYANQVLTADVRTCNVDKQFTVLDAYSVIPNFGLNSNVYNELVQRYMGKELIFPTQSLVIAHMSATLSSTRSSSTFTHTPQFVDSIFFLFPEKPTHHTVFKNPRFTSFQLRCPGFGNLPALPFDTLCEHDPTFIELCQNVLNVNGAQCGINKEVLASLKNLDDNPLGRRSNECTSFFIGLPTETDNTFQQGQKSNTPITYEIVCSFEPDSEYMELEYKPTPLIFFLTDYVISIHIEPNGMPPVVEMGNYNITDVTESGEY